MWLSFWGLLGLLGNPALAGTCTHKVAAGDSITEIFEVIFKGTVDSRKDWSQILYSADGLLNNVKALNPKMRDVHRIYPGQKLKYPCPFISKRLGLNTMDYDPEVGAPPRAKIPKGKPKVTYHQLRRSRKRAEVRAWNLKVRSKPILDPTTGIMVVHSNGMSSLQLMSTDLRRESTGTLTSHYNYRGTLGLEYRPSAFPLILSLSGAFRTYHFGTGGDDEFRQWDAEQGSWFDGEFYAGWSFGFYSGGTTDFLGGVEYSQLPLIISRNKALLTVLTKEFLLGGLMARHQHRIYGKWELGSMIGASFFPGEEEGTSNRFSQVMVGRAGAWVRYRLLKSVSVDLGGRVRLSLTESENINQRILEQVPFVRLRAGL